MPLRAATPFLRVVLAAGVIAVTGLANGATLDLSPDAVLGQPDFITPRGAAPSGVTLGWAYAVAEDPVTGELWVTDGFANRALRFPSAAAFANGAAADLVLGQPDFTSTAINRGGAVSAGGLYQPAGVAVDQAGRVYVADTGNHRILVYKAPFTNGMEAAEVIGQADFTGASPNRGASTAADTFYSPVRLVLDSRGNLFVVDLFNYRVLRFPGPAGTGSVADAVFGQGGSFTSATVATSATGMFRPRGVAIDPSDNLWVADTGNSRAVRFDAGAAGGDVTADLVLCQSNFTFGIGGLTANRCSQVSGVAIDSLGTVYLADHDNHRVLRFTTVATGASASAVIGQENFTSGIENRGGPVGQDTLKMPESVVLDRLGNLLVTDSGNNRVLRYDTPGPRAAPALASLSPASVPQGGGDFVLTVNGSGFHGDSVVNWNGSPRATQYLSSRRLLAQVSAADIATPGPFAVTVTTPAPGGGNSSLLDLATYPRGVLDTVADRVLGQPDFTTGTAPSPRVGEEQVGRRNAATLDAPDDVHLAASGRLFVADAAAHRVVSWASAAAFRNGQPADVILGQPDEFHGACNAGGVSARSLCSPFGVVTDAAGSLYVSDAGNHRVLRFDPPFATGQPASAVFGQGGLFATNVANNGGTGANSLSAPKGLAFSAAALFVHDSGNRRVLVYRNPRGDFTADAAIGQPSLTSAVDEAAGATRFGSGDGKLAVGPGGDLFLSVAGDNRLLRFTPPFATGMAADLVLGQASFSATVAATTATGLRSPGSAGFDPAGNLVVADAGNHRVLRYAAPFASGMAAMDVIGQPDAATATPGTGAATFSDPGALSLDRLGNLFVGERGNGRVLAFDRPLAFAIDPAGDLDGDGLPNALEEAEGRDPYTKDNDLFAEDYDAVRRFTLQQYRDLLGREGDPAGVTGWTTAVVTEAATRARVIEAFLGSAEFDGFVAPVVRLYYATFLRLPDYAGLAFNARLVRDGTVTLEQLADYFAAGPEFQSTYGTLGNAAFVTLLYHHILGRAPDPAGFAGWVALLDGGLSRGAALLGFSESVEYRAAMADEVFVTMMYAGLLRQSPDPAGYGGWLVALRAGTVTREQVVDAFFRSAAYRSRFLP